MSWKSKVLRCACVVAAATTLVLVPAEFSPSQGLAERNACAADEACKREAGSVCMGGGVIRYDYYLWRN